MMTISPTAVDRDGDALWRAVLERDRGCDGAFVFAVLSTRIYCRPSCPARRPARDKVRFFADGVAAQAAGFRACKRCHPDEPVREELAVSRAIALLQGAEGRITLADLAARVGYSPAHFQRLFTQATGLSPAAYARALRIERVGDTLGSAASVTEALYEAGYGAPSRFYAASGERLGMNPSAWRQGGQGVAIRWALVRCSLGQLLVAATDKGVCRVAFGEGEAELAARFPRAALFAGDAEFAQLIGSVVNAVERPGTSHAIPLDVRGTAFQESVWAELRRIPAGETRTYGQIAAAIGRPGAVRAAGSANGANPVAVLIPCHRVVRSDGTLGGYAWGEEIKRELLRREEAAG